MRKRQVIAGGAAAALLAVGYGAMTYYRYGRVYRTLPPNPLLDPLMPRFDVRERHETNVLAPATLTWGAARELDVQGSGLVRSIFRARQLLMGGRTAQEAEPSGSLLDVVLGLGWRVVAEVPERGMVLGAVTRPWTADVVFRGMPPEEFAAFDEPNWVKIAWTIEVTPLSSDRSLFRTETRAVPTDPESRARFRRYWTMVRPGVLLIRREMLRMVKREAEARASREAAPGPRRLGPAHSAAVREPHLPAPMATSRWRLGAEAGRRDGGTPPRPPG